MKFQFKQFSVIQQNSAAKITTDATVFAAWLPIIENHQNVLEIGAGTGVMSLMVAQRTNVSIHAVEIDVNAYEEALNNFKNSPFKNRLSISHTSIQDFDGKTKYDLIFSNPPFFINNLQSSINEAKNTAYHTNSLPFNELAQAADRLLKEDGQVFIMLPLYESKLFDQEMINLGYSIIKTLTVKHNEQKQVLRRIVGFSKNKKYHLEENSLSIRHVDGTFHEDYVRLMQPFLTIF